MIKCSKHFLALWLCLGSVPHTHTHTQTTPPPPPPRSGCTVRTACPSSLYLEISKWSLENDARPVSALHTFSLTVDMFCRVDTMPPNWQVKIIDMDWAGIEGEARYPPVLNRYGFKWPDGVAGAALICQAHDDAFIEQAIDRPPKYRGSAKAAGQKSISSQLKPQRSARRSRPVLSGTCKPLQRCPVAIRGKPLPYCNSRIRTQKVMPHGKSASRWQGILQGPILIQRYVVILMFAGVLLVVPNSICENICAPSTSDLKDIDFIKRQDLYS